ncbi:lipase chaperone [Salinimonas sp. HHU 13199]|uniref:Lipase chaperone n=1 Tax=Salinimonas profundi TaxID=2729140 RepID=A0ABR8LL05_9ALTE|nr:lipase secretion chaperone [Salinimonas profundi]MBD3584749.1 lipase chaperone [Salinimonas profundi]
MQRRGQILCTGLAVSLLIAGWALRFGFGVSQTQPATSKPPVAVSVPSSALRFHSGTEANNDKHYTRTAVSGRHFSLSENTRLEFDRFIFNNEGSAPQVLKKRYAEEVVAPQFEPISASYLIDLFTRYIDYKAQLKALDEPVMSTDIKAMANRLQLKQDLQQTLFSEKEYDYLFAQDAAYDTAALERLQIAADDGLSAQQKARYIESQLDTLPDAQKQSFQPSIHVNRLNSLQRNFDNPETRYQAVSAEFGHEVAQRLNKAADNQSRWQQKVKSFKRWRENLNNSVELSAEQINAQVRQKRESMFSATEQRRLQVYLENPTLLKEGK